MLDPIRILILEDDPDMRRALSQALEEEGYEVSAAASGLEAVEAARATSFDLIVADIRMAGMDGLDALARVREQQPEIRSMVVTGYSTEADSIRAIRLGVGEYLKKPFPIDRFLESVQRQVTLRRQEQGHLARERALLGTARWALEVLAGEAGRELVGLGRLARRAALDLGQAEGPAQEVQLAALAALLLSLQKDQAGLMEGLPRSIRALVDLARAPEAAMPIQAQLVRAMMDLAEHAMMASPSPPEGPGTLLEARHPGRFDQALRDALDRLAREEAREEAREPAPGSAAGRRRGLLTLGRALEEARDAASAGQAYQELADSVSREGVDARLGLARLARARGDAPQAAEQARQAVAMARQVGPGATASACLEAGLLLPPDAASGLLEEAARTFSQLHQPAWQALSLLARAYKSEHEAEPGLVAALVTVTRSELASELRAFLDWLLPLLLRWQAGRPEAEVDRILQRLLREHPTRALKLAELAGPDCRLALAAVLAAPLHEAALRRLEADPEEAVRRMARQRLQAASSAPVPPMLRLYTVGPLLVFRGEERIKDNQWKSQKARHLLACLASNQGRPINEDRIMEEFWPEDPARSKQNVYAAVSSLRKTLRPDSWDGPELDYVLRTPRGLQLNPELPLWQDLDELREQLAQARTEQGAGRHGAEAEALRRAVSYYRGPYLEGCYMDWALAVRGQLELQVVEALRRLVAAGLGQGHRMEVIEHASRLLELDPCCQDAHLALMQVHLEGGRPEEAVRVFEQAVRTLRRELAMEPGIPLLELHQRALLSLSTRGTPS